MRYAALVLLTLLSALPSALPATAQAERPDTLVLVVDSTRSGLRFAARLTTVLGDASGGDSSAVSGLLRIAPSDDGQGGLLVQITDLRLALADSLHLEFVYGVVLGTVRADASPGALALVLREPGPPVPLDGVFFVQPDNDVAMQGAVALRGSGLLGAFFPDTTLAFDVGAVMPLAGAYSEVGSGTGATFTVDAPIRFEGTFENETATLHVTLTGHIVATGAYATGREVAEAPERFRLAPAYPNPFNPRTTLGLALDRPQHVRLAVYDALGREVALLHDGFLDAAAAHAFVLEADALPGGVYLVHARGETASATQQVVLVK